MMRRMGGARHIVDEERLVRRDLLELLHVLDGLVGMKVAKVDASKNRRLCIDLKVMGLPTFLLYRDGQEIGRLSGKEVNQAELGKFVAGYL